MIIYAMTAAARKDAITARVEQCLADCPHRPQVDDLFRCISRSVGSALAVDDVVRIHEVIDRSDTGDEPLIAYVCIEGPNQGISDHCSELWFTEWDDGPWFEWILPVHGPDNRQQSCGECGRRRAWDDYLCSRCRGILTG
jgi:hypothetical protein